MECKSHNTLSNIHTNLSEMLDDLTMLIEKDERHAHNLSLARENVQVMRNMANMLMKKPDYNIDVKVQILDAKSRQFLRDTHSLIEACEGDFL